MSALFDTLADSLGYLLVVAVLFAFPIGISIYSVYEVIEQFVRSDERKKPIPGLRFRSAGNVPIKSDLRSERDLEIVPPIERPDDLPSRAA